MYWEFRLDYGAEPKYIIDKQGNRYLSKGRYKYWLKDENGDKISSYYEDIIYLGNNHFAVANYCPNIVTFNKYVGDELIESRASANNIPLKWGIIKISKSRINNYEFWGEFMVLPAMYDLILPNKDNTITVLNNGKKTFVDIDENSKNYGEQIYPCLFDAVGDFDIQHKGFVEVKLNGITGYIPRNIIKDDPNINLLSNEETATLVKYFNEEISDLDFETRYKYLCLTNETPTLTRILKNNGKN